MLFSSGSLRAGGTNKSITPWRLQTNSNTTRLQTAPFSSSAFPGVVAKQRCSIPPLHTPGLKKSAAPPFHFVAIYSRLINLKGKEFVFGGSKNSNRTDRIATKSLFA
jgi:hypothetical protein